MGSGKPRKPRRSKADALWAELVDLSERTDTVRKIVLTPDDARFLVNLVKAADHMDEALRLLKRYGSLPEGAGPDLSEVVERAEAASDWYQFLRPEDLVG